MTLMQKVSPATLSRRQALRGTAALAGSAALPAAAATPTPAAPAPATQETAAPQDSPGLNTRAMRSNRFFGSAIDSRMLATDRAYMAKVRVECGMVAGERAFKWGALHPQPNKFDFKDADQLMAYARQQSMQVRGHTLLWHEDNPKWLETTITPANAEKLLTDHIRAVAGHCRNRLVQWDVVNEVLWPEDNKPLALRDTIWTRTMGPAALEVAFHTCAETDPTPLRFINEFGLDYDWDTDNRKRDAMLALLHYLRDRQVPVQGVGIQAHIQAGVKEFSQTKLAKFCTDIAAMGLKIVITELDVRDNREPADIATRDAAVAAQTRAYLDAMLDSPAVLGVLSWGLSDRRSWLNDELPRSDKLPQRPLPLDAALNRKPMWTAIAEAFDAAPIRT